MSKRTFSGDLRKLFRFIKGKKKKKDGLLSKTIKHMKRD